MFRLSMLLIIFIFLPSCINIATTGAEVVYNRQSLQKKFNDQYITLQIYRALKFKDKQFADSNVAISTFHGQVLLAGQVRHYWQKLKAEKVARSMPEVETVYNLLTVANPSSSLTRISDAWLTAKIKAKLIASDDVDATQIKVVTENGTVYLMGILSPREAQAAVDLASATDGVESVVKIFSYLRITKR